ncbi:tRNA epoxyqueuosine(34) reductase QueG [Massilia sp. W12]|uniref:tRNA epoxyqueuosine(34) reductase QueG n=1 Tax=Massilia sp. W12 TaxID=3126507 RepID=UPI0030CB6674
MHNPSQSTQRPGADSGLLLQQLAQELKQQAHILGFHGARIAPAWLPQAEQPYQDWLAQGFHGEMDYMASHGLKRIHPALLQAGTQAVLSVRIDYLPGQQENGEDKDWRAREWRRIADPRAAQVALYARGRDYHKVVRNRLQQLAQWLEQRCCELGLTPALESRAFADSAPVLEVELGKQSGLGWRGKHTLLLTREAGSMFFLGELFVNLALPPDPPLSNHCGQCRACIDICPTGAILGPGQLDARRCISYLTIELKGSIPEALRPLLGNRIYGCDDCQLACPWNKFAQSTALPDFAPRHQLDQADLLTLFAWDEATFLQKMEGSAIRRIGHERWLRNLAVGLGNAARSVKGNPAIVAALQSRAHHPSELVREHVAWALQQHGVAP